MNSTTFLTTLGSWKRAEGKLKNPRLWAVKVEDKRAAGKALSGASFTLNFANGRRIESGWNFADADLIRVIRVAENAQRCYSAWVCRTQPTSAWKRWTCRKGFNGLYGLVRDHLGQDPLKSSECCSTGWILRKRNHVRSVPAPAA